MAGAMHRMLRRRASVVRALPNIGACKVRSRTDASAQGRYGGKRAPVPCLICHCKRSQPKETAVRSPVKHKTHPTHDIPELPAPDSLPVEPDQGTVPAAIPDDPEHDRAIDPGG